ncbi:MAG TPA: lysophospholipid acyltransferase family protein [Victivallales bacterium]|nr:lysophospholipid acyltransferase family protein [Victivallales bacterium]
MRPIFTEDKYFTPQDTKILTFASFTTIRTLFFYYHIIRMVMRAEKVARKGHYDYDEWAKSSFETIKIAESCGAKVSITGLENLKLSEKPVVFIGNHMSVFETFAIACMLIPYKRPAFVIKKELLDYPVFGKVMRSLSYISVERKNPKDDFKAVIEQGCKLISEGYSPVVFPQATRMREFIPERFNTIGIKLAKKASVPVIPFALKTDFWGTGKIFKDFGQIGKFSKKIFFEFLKPIVISGNGKEEHEIIINFIQGKLKEWNECK